MKTLIFLLLLAPVALAQQPTTWQHLSTETGDLEVPGPSQQQTAALVTDLNGDGLNDLVVACRQKAPALVWYERQPKGGWQRRVIEPALLTIEAGGAAHDVDGDGDLDLIFGGDWQSREVWWFENPGTLNAKPETLNWQRHVIKAAGNTQHHDQIVGDFKQTGKPQVVFWNQGSKTLYLADIPADPKGKWRFEPVFSGEAGEKSSWYAEGLAKADVDGDGHVDLLGGNYWFKFQKSTGAFRPVRVGEQGGRIGVGQFKPGKIPQIVISPGDGKGRLMFYEFTGNPGVDSPEDSTKWRGRDLLGREMIHGHTLEVADLDGDGHLDLFAAEMAKWHETQEQPDNPAAEALIFYGDGNGNFRKEVFKTGWDFHEGRLADLDGDGDLDIFCKPYTWKAPRLDVWLQNGTGASARKK
jgi:hypothetical protein